MSSKPDVPTVRQCAEFMLQGPDRDAMFRFAREYFEAHDGPEHEERVAGLARAAQRYERLHEQQDAEADGEPPRGMRDYLSATRELGKREILLKNLWEESYRCARGRFWRENKRLPFEQVWPWDEKPAPKAPVSGWFDKLVKGKSTESIEALLNKTAVDEAKAKAAPPSQAEPAEPETTTVPAAKRQANMREAEVGELQVQQVELMEPATEALRG